MKDVKKDPYKMLKDKILNDWFKNMHWRKLTKRTWEKGNFMNFKTAIKLSKMKYRQRKFKCKFWGHTIQDITQDHRIEV